MVVTIFQNGHWSLIDTSMSSASVGICEVYAKLEAYRINIWANVFPMIYYMYSYDSLFVVFILWNWF